MVDNVKSFFYKMFVRCGNNCRKDVIYGIKEGWGIRIWEVLLESFVVFNS